MRIKWIIIVLICILLGWVFKIRKRFRNWNNIYKNKSMVIVNKSIMNNEDDLFGMETYVNKMISAIRGGANSIGVFSPLGSGKSSLINLFENDTKYYYKVVRINLWLNVDENDPDIHKSFLYQLSKHLKLNTSYLSKKLSNKFNSLEFEVEKKISKILLIFLALIVTYIYIYNNNFSKLKNLSNVKGWNLNIMFIVYAICIIVGLVIVVYYLSSFGILYSSKNQDKNVNKENSLTSVEITDQFSRLVKRFSNKIRFNRKLIIVIEDLDRTKDKKNINDFLKSLHKLYMDHSDNVVFVTCIDKVNIKDESDFYSKIFDFSFTLKKLSKTDNEVFVNSFLDKLTSGKNSIFGKPDDKGSYFTTVKGLDWIIRGEGLQVRQIKESINEVVIEYHSIEERHEVGDKGKTLESLFAFSYLNRQFKDYMKNLKDETIENLIDKKINGDLLMEDLTTNDFITEIKAKRDEVQDQFAEDMYSMLKSGVIDETYALYRYNTPKNSKVLKAIERKVSNNILYNKPVLENSVAELDSIFSSNPEVVMMAIDRLDRLSILYGELLLSSVKVSKYLNKLDIYANTYHESIATRIVNKKSTIVELINIFEVFCNELDILETHFNIIIENSPHELQSKLRKAIISNYLFEKINEDDTENDTEFISYDIPKILGIIYHNVSNVDIEEFDGKIPDLDVINIFKIINYSKKDIEVISKYLNESFSSSESIDKIMEIFEEVPVSISENLLSYIDFKKFNIDEMENKSKYFSELSQKLSKESIGDKLELMINLNTVISEVEELVLSANTKNYKIKYLEFVNNIYGTRELTDQTYENIKKIPIFMEYSEPLENKIKNEKIYDKYVYSFVVRNKKYFVKPTKIEKNTTVDLFFEMYGDVEYEEFVSIILTDNNIIELILSDVRFNKTPKEEYALFANYPQTSSMLKNLQDYPYNIITEYLLNIKSFSDDEAEKICLEIITSNMIFLQDENIKENIYTKLNSVNKRSLTRAINNS